MIWGCKVPRLQTSTKRGGGGESDFTLRARGKAQASFQRGLDETHCTLWLCWKCLNYLGWSDLKIKKTASCKVPWRSLLCRDLHYSSGLVIKPNHSWGTESYLHISNEFEECHRQQSKLVLAPTTLSFGCRRLVEQGPQPQSAERCHPLYSALRASCFMNVGRATGKIYCHLSQSTVTYWKTPCNFPSVPRSQTTNWIETHIRPYKLTRY